MIGYHPDQTFTKMNFKLYHFRFISPIGQQSADDPVKNDMHLFCLQYTDYDNKWFSMGGAGNGDVACGTMLFFEWNPPDQEYPVQDTNFTVHINVWDLGRNQKDFLLPVMIKGSHFNTTIAEEEQVYVVTQVEPKANQATAGIVTAGVVAGSWAIVQITNYIQAAYFA